MASERLTCPRCEGCGELFQRGKTCYICKGTGYVDIEFGKTIQTNADRIRSMDNKQLSEFIYAISPGNRFFCDMCPRAHDCMDIINSEGKEIPGDWCEETFLAWLNTPVYEMPAFPYEDKQESGLLEEG